MIFLLLLLLLIIIIIIIGALWYTTSRNGIQNNCNNQRYKHYWIIPIIHQFTHYWQCNTFPIIAIMTSTYSRIFCRISGRISSWRNCGCIAWWLCGNTTWVICRYIYCWNLCWIISWIRTRGWTCVRVLPLLLMNLNCLLLMRCMSLEHLLNSNSHLNMNRNTHIFWNYMSSTSESRWKIQDATAFSW